MIARLLSRWFVRRAEHNERVAKLVEVQSEAIELLLVERAKLSEQRRQYQLLARGIEAIISHPRFVGCGTTIEAETPSIKGIRMYWVDGKNRVGNVWRVFDRDIEDVVRGALRVLGKAEEQDAEAEKQEEAQKAR